MAAVAHEIMLEGQRAVWGLHPSAHRIVGHWQDAMPNAELLGQDRRGRGKSYALVQQAAAAHMQGQIAVAQAEPRLAAELRQRLHEMPALIGAPPTRGGICGVRQRIYKCVYVGRDVQAKVLEIVAGVDDEGEIVRRQQFGEAER